MKKMKYLGTGALVLALALAGMSGCGKKALTMEEILAKVDENTKAASGMTGQMEMVMDAKISASGVSMDMSLNMDMDMKTSKTEDSEMSYVGGELQVSAMGQDMSMDMEAYTIQEGDTMKSYTCTDGEWTYTEGDADGASEMAESMSAFYEDASDWTLGEKTEEKNGVSCFVLTGKVSGSDMEAYTEMTESLGGDADLSQMEMPVTLYVDAEKLLPVSILVDGTEAMTKMMAGTEAADSEFKAFTIEINNVTYEDVEITIPEEALAAEGASPAEPEAESPEETAAPAETTAVPGAESEPAGGQPEAAAPAGALATIVDLKVIQ